MLLSLKSSRLPFHINAKFLALLIPAQLICFLLIYPIPFRDGTSWGHPLRKLSLGAGWHIGNQVPIPEPISQWSGEKDPTKVGAIVAGVLSSAEVEWMEDLTSNWTIHITNVLNTTIHPLNKGHESMVYLNYILEHWDSLAPVTLFIHGHLESWHQDFSMNETIKTLNLTEVEKEGFVNLRCDWAHGCPDRMETIISPYGTIDIKSDSGEEYLVMKGVFEVFAEVFPTEPLPEHLASPCCAQFAVTRDSIHRRGKDVFENLRAWLTKTRYNDHISGTVVERLWAYTLRGPHQDTVFCITPEFCRCRFYGKCKEPLIYEYDYDGPTGDSPPAVRFKVRPPGSESELESEPKGNQPPS